MPSAGELIFQHPVNPVDNPKMTSYTDKAWAQEYAPIRNLKVHTTVDYDGMVHSTFDPAFLPLCADEEKRTNEPAHPPNDRFWRLEMEADMEHWWHTEISDVVLAAWARYPGIAQTCHTAPLTEVNTPENVDCTYGMYVGNQRVPVAIGEIKRNLINAVRWQQANLGSPQQKLARELRGYADKYQCPHIFCWDGQVLLILQFQAQKPEHIRHPDCVVDCWVIPAAKTSCTLRYALYRLLVQGLRRCQALAAQQPLTVGTLTERHGGREFYTGRPVWENLNEGQLSYDHPEGYRRHVDPATGALYWSHDLIAEDVVWETGPFWE